MKRSKLLDTHYFGKKLTELARDVGLYTSEELARALARLARTACPEVLSEAEFSLEADTQPAADYRNQTLFQVTGSAPGDPGAPPCPGRTISVHIPANSPVEALNAYHEATAELHGKKVSRVQDVSVYGHYDDQGQLSLAPRSTLENHNQLVDVTARALASHPRAAEFVGKGHHALWQGLLDEVCEELKISLVATDFIPALQQAAAMIDSEHGRKALIGQVATQALVHSIDHDYNVEDLDMALTGVSEAAEYLDVDLSLDELRAAAHRLLEGAECLRLERMEGQAWLER